MSFIETDAKEKLIPVLGQVLSLSPEELARLQKKSAPVAATTGVFGGLWGS